MEPSFVFPLVAADFAAVAQAQFSISDALLLLLTAGMLMALCQLQQLLRRMEILEKHLAATRTTKVPAEPSRVAQPAAEDAPPPELLAVIAAAVHATADGPVRIVSIADGSDPKQVWSLEGRRQIFASHQVR